MSHVASLKSEIIYEPSKEVTKCIGAIAKRSSVGNSGHECKVVSAPSDWFRAKLANFLQANTRQRASKRRVEEGEGFTHKQGGPLSNVREGSKDIGTLDLAKKLRVEVLISQEGHVKAIGLGKEVGLGKEGRAAKDGVVVGGAIGALDGQVVVGGDVGGGQQEKERGRGRGGKYWIAQ
ncbi:hypothetical protein L7F22_012562 [Adiantum nelumboides]|nr:hypothetical protein [Adiantum nelumboides]